MSMASRRLVTQVHARLCGREDVRLDPQARGVREERVVAGQPAGALVLDRQRIRHLTGDSPQRSRVTIIGLGSGGFPVMQHLAMSGWRRFTLIDHDVLEDVNLVKHPARRSDLGRLKADIAAEWLADRNPASEVTALAADFLELSAADVDKIMAE